MDNPIFDTFGLSVDEHIGINGTYIKSSRGPKRLRVYLFVKHGDYSVVVDSLSNPILYFNSSLEAYLPSGKYYGRLQDCFNGKMLFKRFDDVQIEYPYVENHDKYFDVELLIANDYVPTNPFVEEVENKHLPSDDVRNALKVANERLVQQMVLARIRQLVLIANRKYQFEYGTLTLSWLKRFKSSRVLTFCDNLKVVYLECALKHYRNSIIYISELYDHVK